MDIELRYFGTVRQAVGNSTEDRSIEAGATVRSVLAELEREYPELSGLLLDGEELSSAVTVLKNGTHITHFDGLETGFADGDQLSITPPVTGGSFG
jgi:molybdopterin synthase sulfur carrier subunit